jgi:hypothetical protein
MAFTVLNQPATQDLVTRVTNLEQAELARQLAGVSASRVYAGGYVPTSLTAGGTDTAGVATQVWVSELRLNGNVLITGLSYLIGSVGGTDKAIAVLYDANGNVLANSALAGVTVGTASTFQRLPFVTPYQASPGLYYVGISTNGATAKIQTHPAGDHNAGVITGQVFGTLLPITPPVTFTAAKAPIVMTY